MPSEEHGILLPPKIYLDTNHLINITKARRCASTSAYSTLDGYLRSGYVGIIFSPAAALDWIDGNATVETAKELADVVDSSRLQYEIEQDSFVFLHEIQAELRRIEPSIRLPSFDVFFCETTQRRLAGHFLFSRTMCRAFLSQENSFTPMSNCPTT